LLVNIDDGGNLANNNNNNNNNNSNDHNDDKLQKDQSQKIHVSRKARWICAVLATATLLVVHTRWSQTSHGSHPELLNTGAGTVVSKPELGGGDSNSNSNIIKKEDYELYPFLVNSDAVSSSASASGIASTALLSKPTLPEFPVISKLEDCTVAYTPSSPARTTASEWRRKFWIPSIPGSGASNPTRKGDLLREIIEGLFRGDGSDYNQTPVKEFHMSIKNRLKRCTGVSETVGCSCNHPLVPVNAETQTDQFRPGAILSIRNPATVIPMYYAYKHIAYQKATKQAPEEDWRNMRDLYWEGSFQNWMNVIQFWRGTAEESSYYSTVIYVPFEDLVTTDASKGIPKIRELSDAISGRKSPNTKDDDDDGFFETTDAEQDYECLWYRAAKREWEREQTIIGDYVPAYTQAQKDKMVKDLRAYAADVEKDPFQGDQDMVLVSLLRRYAHQIEEYLLVEEPQATKPS